jgi:hypothetical protein
LRLVPVRAWSGAQGRFPDGQRAFVQGLGLKVLGPAPEIAAALIQQRRRGGGLGVDRAGVASGG